MQPCPNKWSHGRPWSILRARMPARLILEERLGKHFTAAPKEKWAWR